MYFKGFPRFIINILKTRNTSIILLQSLTKQRSEVERKGQKAIAKNIYIKKQQQNKTNKTKRKKERVLRLRI